MKYANLSLCCALCLSLLACQTPAEQGPLSVSAPSGKLRAEVLLTEQGQPAYQVFYDDQPIIRTSTLGFDLQGAPPLGAGMAIESHERRTFNESWEMPWGEQREVANHYNELAVAFQETAEPQRLFRLVFRLYDDGLGFRYEFPEQPNMQEAIIMDELTQFQLTADHDCWWQPGDWDIYEHLYNASKVSQIDALSKRDHPNLAQTYIPYNAVNTPFTLRTAEGLHLSFHEAALTDYADMTLKVDNNTFLLQSGLAGSDRLGYKAKRALPFHTPWRTLQVS